jgi:hypothetical protein
MLESLPYNFFRAKQKYIFPSMTEQIFGDKEIIKIVSLDISLERS